MSSHRAAHALVNVPAPKQGIAASLLSDADATGSRLMRLLVLDEDPRTPQLIENALWTWPHRIATANDAQSAARMCEHLEPIALVASLKYPSDHDTGIVGALREEMPNAVVIALGSPAQAANPRSILEAGANAVLTHDELQRPTLYDLLMRLRPQQTDEVMQLVPGDTVMPLPWRESQLMGSLICDVKGTISHANECLSRWLCYPTPAALSGKCIWRDILDSPADWKPWVTIAGDMSALLQQSISVKTNNRQLLWMSVEVFAAPSSPTDIQAVFVDQSELAQLRGHTAGA